jgi:hypothetical protein
MLDTNSCADALDIPRQKATDTYARKLQIALARARANVARLSEGLAKPWPGKTGHQLTDALALIAQEADKCRLRAWEYLAELRAEVCEPASGRNTDWVRNRLAGELHELSTLGSRRRQAIRNGGAAELEYHLRMHRSMRARWMRDLYLERAEFHNSCLWIEPGDAACEVISINEALSLYRADIWRHIADMHQRRAEGLEPDLDAVADLRFCRLHIAELNAGLPAAEAASRAEYVAEAIDMISRGTMMLMRLHDQPLA